jgi:30S ribosomal protein S31
MGKGDKRSRRGKIFAGSYGKSRPKPKKGSFVTAEAAGQSGEKAASKPKVRVRKKTESA